MNRMASMPITVKILMGLHFFLGVGALFGGGALVLDPSGQGLGMPPDMMRVPVFTNFLIPGLILFLVLGIGPLGVLFSLLGKKRWKLGEALNVFKTVHWSWTFSLYTGFVLIIWITVQMYVLDAVYIVHLVYMFLGLLIQIVTLLPTTQDYYRET
ncbi:MULTISPECIES: hypothetical protein [Paenibacillus]|uniref:hypothetical protein n=1 Tax=Paenibacillus TaxID=44249 RepID=UPI002FE041BD